MSHVVVGTAAAVVSANVLFGIGATAILGYYARKSFQRRRLDPMLLLTLAMACLTWMEAPYDWGMFAAYHPDFPRVPGWGALQLAGLSEKGPFGLTHGGLPWIAIPGYPFYWVLPLVFSVGAAKRLAERRGLSYGQSLLCVGLVTGFAWDLFFEILGTRVGVWRFSRVPWGLGLFHGEAYQISLGTSLASGVFVMGCAYLFGRKDDQGDDLLRRWARRHSRSNRTLNTLHFGSTLIYLQLLYGAMLIPHLATNVWGLTTTAAKEPIFEGMQNQWSPPTHDGPLGFAILVGSTVLCFVVAMVLVRRFDGRIASGASAELPTGVRATKRHALERV